MPRSPSRFQVIRYVPAPHVPLSSSDNVARSLSTVPARASSRVGAGLIAGAAVAGYAAYECKLARTDLYGSS